MPYAMRIVGGVFIHEVAISPDGRRLGSSSIGSPASHGCIRVPVGTAANVYHMSHVGMPVSIR
jgi:lipoprotein-anchoring transpeptidase ErfK/SrfK